MGPTLRMLAITILLMAGYGSAMAGADVSETVLARAIEAYKAGDIDPAIGGINAAMRGRLSAESMSKAYYYRGLAHRKAGQPGQAIVDLTKALEYTDLAEPDRSNASENLQVAYEEAGIAPNEKVVVGKPVREPSAAAGATASVTKPAASEPRSGGSAPAAQEWPAASTTPAEPAMPRQNSTTARSTSWVSQQVALSPLPPVPPTKKPTIPAVATKTTAVARQQPPVTPVAFAPFSTEVQVAPSPGFTSSGGDMRLLVGETRTRSEAFELAIRLTSQRGSALGPRPPQVVAGSIGETVSYRLRLGPFTDVGQAMSLCQSLRDSGFACVPE